MGIARVTAASGQVKIVYPGAGSRGCKNKKKKGTGKLSDCLIMWNTVLGDILQNCYMMLEELAFKEY